MTDGVTSIYDRFEYLDKRFKEIDIIIEQAKINRENEDVYKTLCRSAQVLLAAHYEGAIKDFVKDFINDINDYGIYKDLSTPIKRTFCNHFYAKVKNEKGINENSIEECKTTLVDYFEPYNIKFIPEPFLYTHNPEIRSDSNKNMSPKALDNYSKKFGIESIFSILYNSKLDVAFENSRSGSEELKKELKNALINGTKTYPYIIDMGSFSFNIDTPLKEKTLWQTFIDEVIEIRNDIAHGELPSRDTSIEDIELSRLKMELLLYAFAIIICNTITPFNPGKSIPMTSESNMDLLFDNI